MWVQRTNGSDLVGAYNGMASRQSRYSTMLPFKSKDDFHKGQILYFFIQIDTGVKSQQSQDRGDPRRFIPIRSAESFSGDFWGREANFDIIACDHKSEAINESSIDDSQVDTGVRPAATGKIRPALIVGVNHRARNLHLAPMTTAGNMIHPAWQALDDDPPINSGSQSVSIWMGNPTTTPMIFNNGAAMGRPHNKVGQPPISTQNMKNYSERRELYKANHGEDDLGAKCSTLERAKDRIRARDSYRGGGGPATNSNAHVPVTNQSAPVYYHGQQPSTIGQNVHSPPFVPGGTWNMPTQPTVYGNAGYYGPNNFPTAPALQAPPVFNAVPIQQREAPVSRHVEFNASYGRNFWKLYWRDGSSAVTSVGTQDTFNLGAWDFHTPVQ
ncbi:hypothetical protein C8R43DRAFT_956037 [Mycena crocata]|nr:hypothetical protein C8R43DRAFT_956037 [Mycena crocata]